MPSTPITRVSLALAAIFLFLAAMHAYWALTLVPDGVRPTFADEPLPQPHPLVTSGVAVPLTLAAVVVLARAGLILQQLPTWVPRVGCWGLGLIMVFRAIGELRFVGFFKSIRDTRFAVWDTWLYSPLCLLLGVGALWLAVGTRWQRSSSRRSS